MLHATSLRIPIVEVEGGTLTALAGFDGHQGIALVTRPRQYSTLDAALARAIERGEPPFLLVLDSLEDPQNLGTLLRSAEAAGIQGVVFPTRRQAPLTPAAIKASAGAVEHLLLVPTDDLAGTLADLHVRGLRIVGAEAEAPMTARQADLRGPVALVIGSEGQGLGPAIRRRCDQLVRIPMRGKVASLNAAVAGSVLLYEASAQREEAAATTRPAPVTPSEEAEGEPGGPKRPDEAARRARSSTTRRASKASVAKVRTDERIDATRSVPSQAAESAESSEDPATPEGPVAPEGSNPAEDSAGVEGSNAADAQEALGAHEPQAPQQPHVAEEGHVAQVADEADDGLLPGAPPARPLASGEAGSASDA